MLVKMFERRLRGYRAIGYNRDELSLDSSGGGDKIIVEYDEEARCDEEEQRP